MGDTPKWDEAMVSPIADIKAAIAEMKRRPAVSEFSYSRYPPRPNAIRLVRHDEPVQVGPVHAHGGGPALYDCPCGCGLWTSEPAKRCGMCEQLKPATHWDGLVDCCGDCAKTAYDD